jgi:hypothetical protein
MAWLKKDIDNEEIVEDELAKEDKAESTQLLSNEDKDRYYMEQENDVQRELVSTIRQIDTLYKDGVLQYKESIYQYNIEIEKLKSNIENESKKSEQKEYDLLMIENEITYEAKLVDKQNSKFIEKVKSIDELKHDYKNVMEKQVYEEVLARKERELFDMLDDLEELELSLLNKELIRLNKVERLDPLRTKIYDLKVELRDLELKKNYLENTGLGKVSIPQLEHNINHTLEDRKIVDTIIMDEK